MISSSHRDIVLYGAGNFGIKVLNHLTLKKEQVKCFVDETPDKIGSKILGTPVLSLKEAVATYIDAVWIICIFQPSVNLTRKYQEFKDLGIKDIVISTEFISSNKDFVDRLFFPTSKVSKNDEMIVCDDLSKIIYANFLTLCNTGRSDENLVTPPFDNELLQSVPHNKIYDLGAFDGDSHQQLSKLYHVSYAAYEPDLINFKKLQKYKNDIDDPRFIIFNKAVGPETGLVAFSQDGTMGSKIIAYESQHKGNASECVSLKSILDVETVNSAIIKMDIEGVELKTILSSIEEIKQKSPVLIISAYHNQNDLEQLYSELSNLQIYDFYIRQHGFNGMDLMLYCLPRKL